jgi:hypothetical protein
MSPAAVEEEAGVFALEARLSSAPQQGAVTASIPSEDEETRDEPKATPNEEA